MIRFGTYLLQNSYGIYHFRMSVPLDLRPVLGKREFKKSLRTSNLVYARKAAYCYAIDIQILFEEVRSQIQGVRSHMFSDDDIKRLSNSSPRFEHGGIKINGSSIEIGPAKTDPNNPNDLKDLNAYIDKIKEMFPNSNIELNNNISIEKSQETDETQSLLLDELYEKFKSNQISEKIWKRPKTFRDRDSTKDAIIRILDNVPVKTIDAKLAVQLKETLYKYPKNVSNKPDYKNLTLPQIKSKKIPKKDLLDPDTVRKYIAFMSSIFKYAVAHNYATKNPFANIVPKRNTSKYNKKRNKFSDEELQTIFSSDIYTKHIYEKPHQYWLPLLGLFTGARISEICQLKLEDISTIKGILTIKICAESEDQSVKTDASIRLVPVHSSLIDLGFSRYVKSLETLNSERLFPEINPYYDKRYHYFNWGHGPSKWFASYLKTLEIKTQKLVFHSLRYNMITKLANARVQKEFASALTGHEYEKRTTHDDYIDGFEIEVLKEDIEKAKFESVLNLVKPYPDRGPDA